MNQEIVARGKTEDLALIAKALTATRNKRSLGDRNLIGHVGKFRRSGVLHYTVTGEIEPDYNQDKFYGVGLNDMLNMLLAAIPGVVEDNMRPACAVLLEVQRADLAGRQLQRVVWTDSDDAAHTITIPEIKAALTRVENLKEKAGRVTAEFAKQIKTTRRQRGAVQIESAEFEVEKPSNVVGEASLETLEG